MKTVTIILFTILLNACGSAKTSANNTNNSTKTNITEVNKIAQDDLKIVYKQHARGGFKQVVLYKKTVSVQKGYNAKAIVTNCNEKDWNALISLVESSNLKAMTTLEAPSKAHQYDGAPMANLTITKGDIVYDLKPFDAGNPHEKCTTLVNMILNIAGFNKE